MQRLRIIHLTAANGLEYTFWFFIESLEDGIFFESSDPPMVSVDDLRAAPVELPC